MSSKRSGDLISNPFIKKRNLQWTLTTSNPSPPPTTSDKSSTAAIESGAARITNPLVHFTTHLQQYILPSPSPLLPITTYNNLYATSLTPQASHFVIHQHDHPVAGLHYDLRLQINPSSSVSWAIMYGLPGDPNSIRLNRNATETRIHSLWNHLIETASSETGSLLIWDTGTYAILPRRSKYAPKIDPSSQSTQSSQSPRTQQELLQEAFHNRKIRIQLRGAKLPETYVLNIRLTKKEDAEGRAKTRGPRRRKKVTKTDPETSSDSNDDQSDDEPDIVPKGKEVGSSDVSPVDKELQELEDAEVRRTNAYPGASNTIGSIHQRRWYLSLDRRACGFVERRESGKIVWELPSAELASKPPQQDKKVDGMQRLNYPFYVKGVEHERSVVTAQTGEDIMRDEGVNRFVRRKGWMPVLN